MDSVYREAIAPYPGLRPFESHEADVFFGREEHTDRLLEILQAQYFLAVIGPSGSGKSSVVRAGLLPALAMGSLGSGSEWRVALMRPGGRPLSALAASLLRPGVLGAELGVAAEDTQPDAALVATLASELRRGPLGLRHVVQSAWDRITGQAPNLLVLVDQFEELFTYADAAAADESDAFVQLLLTARATPDARIHVALTMRTDFLGQCVSFADLPEAINRAQYLIPRLTRAQMERAIVGPAQVFGGDVEPTLVTELINATGQNSDQLPLVQHALSRMWQLALHRNPKAPRIDWDDERAVGGVHGALGQHAEALLTQAQSALPPSQVHLPEALLRSITARRAGGQDVRQPRTLARITRACGVSPDEWPLLAAIVARFSAADACMLQHGSSLDPASVIDLSHEALMRQWPRLAGWVADEARKGAEYRRWLERASDHATGHGSLLDGADLARAIEWWNPDVDTSGRNWQPSAVWAERYATVDDTESARLEFQRTVGFIADSRAARQRIDAERARAEAEARTLDLERQHARDNERMLRRLKRLIVVSGAFLLLALFAGVVAWQQSKARILQSDSFAKFAAKRAAEAVSALEEIKRQQAAAEEQRLRAERESNRAKSETARAERQQQRFRTLLAQDVLNSMYDSGINKDGLFGGRTSAALRRLQLEAGLEQTGQLDEATWTCVEALTKVEVNTRKAALARTCR